MLMTSKQGATIQGSVWMESLNGRVHRDINQHLLQLIVLTIPVHRDLLYQELLCLRHQ